MTTVNNLEQDQQVVDAVVATVQLAFKAGFSEEEIFGLFEHIVEEEYFEQIMRTPVLV